MVFKIIGVMETGVYFVVYVYVHVGGGVCACACWCACVRVWGVSVWGCLCLHVCRCGWVCGWVVCLFEHVHVCVSVSVCKQILPPHTQHTPVLDGLTI